MCVDLGNKCRAQSRGFVGVGHRKPSERPDLAGQRRRRHAIGRGVSDRLGAVIGGSTATTRSENRRTNGCGDDECEYATLGCNVSTHVRSPLEVRCALRAAGGY